MIMISSPPKLIILHFEKFHQKNFSFMNFIQRKFVLKTEVILPAFRINLSHTKKNNMETTQEVRPLSVCFVDYTTTEPVILGKSLFSFFPYFNAGDLVTFNKGDSSLTPIGCKTATHIVSNIQWCFETIEPDSVTVNPSLVITLKRIEQRKSIPIQQIASAFR